MASLKAVRAAIQTTIQTNIAGIQVYQRIPDSPVLPCVVVRPDGTDFNQAFGRGTDQYTFELQVVVPSNDADVAQNMLDDYVTGAGAKSIRQVIFNNKTLGLAATAAVITEMTNYAFTYDAVGSPNIGATLRLVVHTDGTA
jgi:hypothetical protein